MPVLWFQGPDGAPFQFQCGQGIHIPSLADELRLQPRPLKLNGVVVDFDSSTGYSPFPDLQEALGEHAGTTRESAIQVTGQPAGRAPADAGGAASTAATAAAAAAGVDGAPLPPDAADFVSRIVLDGQTIGTIVRIKKDGLCVTAAHCLVEKGKFLEHASAFGGKLQLIGSSPFHDIIFVQGEPGKAVQLSQQQLQVSQEVCMLGFPLAVDKDLGSKEHPTSMPTVTRGQVVAISFPTGELAAADYSGALPNASGGAVLSARSDLAGVHVGASCHVDYSHKPEQEEDAPPRELWDMDPGAMWQGSSASSQGKRRRQPEQPEQPAAHDVNNLALHAAANIVHKGQLALFVPAATIWQLGQQLGQLQLSDDLALVQRRHATHCYSRA